jgi:hypothetical protein
MGIVAKPRDEQANMYVMANIVVCLLDHVSALDKVGNGYWNKRGLLVKMLKNEIAVRTNQERMDATNRGKNGYPDEKSAMYSLVNSVGDRPCSSMDAMNRPKRGKVCNTLQSAKKTAVQSESKTRFAFGPRQYLDRASFWAAECTKTTLYGYIIYEVYKHHHHHHPTKKQPKQKCISRRRFSPSPHVYIKALY